MGAQNNQPKMTINKLGEYLVASPRRKRSILETLKYPKEDGGQWGHVHSEARNAIKRYFVSGFDKKYITKCIASLKSKSGTKDEKNYHASSILLLETILKSENIDFDAYDYEPYNVKNAYLDIEGVKINVYPDLLVKSTSRGKNYIGALKLHLVKNSEINDEAGRYIATILNRYADGFILTDRKIRTNHNISYDVISDRFIECPGSVKNRWKNIEAECKNIVAIWGSI
ncbi:hypothetical protein OU798_04430 [Prolixibacteraceae bacterium Z1-6]|uniref:Uncharacterized protein n=1 Tax=Draconibacterium aestuarii TaxID=2998507 RepID=A0A9X3FBL7_9BACT|nr:hypothetical protein [Prolixibacteraceae bacterium Z1-6]